MKCIYLIFHSLLWQQGIIPFLFDSWDINLSPTINFPEFLFCEKTFLASCVKIIQNNAVKAHIAQEKKNIPTAEHDCVLYKNGKQWVTVTGHP